MAASATEWVNEKLGSKIVDGQIILGDLGASVDIETFVTFFGASIEDDKKKDKYLALLGPQTFQWNGESVTRTGEELGYKSYFDAWHAEGLI
ncbi:hypothetical protein [Paenibacillus sp. RUD330]|uniref:hypothetical protein n=1 Tax=Paenibacillus sp. RUD330 TaxID=2023772 RepID=UPI000B92D0F3|nr:hypothetical protein [Paenibacillus sp. RUD330]ASS66566.1 hypothetical protein CIC07_10640 [Paenibacillus sp. RUD330]